jgi:hypothetical protein
MREDMELEKRKEPQQCNPFQTNVKYEFLLIAINPIIGLIYQIFKGIAWLIRK